jgi:hypothetical protein
MEVNEPGNLGAMPPDARRCCTANMHYRPNTIDLPPGQVMR